MQDKRVPMAKMADFRSRGSECGSRATGFDMNRNETLMKGFLTDLHS